MSKVCGSGWMVAAMEPEVRVVPLSVREILGSTEGLPSG
jgi:hypothetical protein